MNYSVSRICLGFVGGVKILEEFFLKLLALSWSDLFAEVRILAYLVFVCGLFVW